jgi:hypothetical protein
MSLTAHGVIACFFAAAYETMLEWLKNKQEQDQLDPEMLRGWWHGVMERKAGQKNRLAFYSEVIAKADTVSRQFLKFQNSHCR